MPVSRIPLRALGLCLLGVLPLSEASAQRRPARIDHRSGLITAAATLVRPVGEFQDFISWGGGLSLAGIIHTGPDGPWGIRIDASLTDYGLENLTANVSVASRIDERVRVTTNNLIMSLGVGPQYSHVNGRVAPYAFGTVGVSYFATITSATPFPGGEPVVSETNFDDLTPIAGGGAGLLVALGRGHHAPSLDFGLSGQFNGKVRYLRRGGLVGNPDGSPTLETIESRANTVALRVGVAFRV